MTPSETMSVRVRCVYSNVHTTPVCVWKSLAASSGATNELIVL